MLTVISGGQTGVDQTALKVARECGFPTGGMAPLGWQTDEGPAPWLADYGLVESRFRGYRVRTIENVRAAQATVWFGAESSPGGQLTLNTARALGKILRVNPTTEDLYITLTTQPIEILNVAGNRLRTYPLSTVRASEVLRATFNRLREPSIPVQDAITDDAIEQAELGAPDGWVECVLPVVQRLAQEYASLTTDQVWERLPLDLMLPLDKRRSMGCVMRAAAAEKWIASTETYTKSTRAIRHRRSLLVWRSLVHAQAQ